jgi:hypothetical protein
VLVQSRGVPKAVEFFFDRPADVPPARSELVETLEIAGALGDMPGCSVSLTTKSFCSVVNRRRRATPVITSTFENVSDIGVCLAKCCSAKDR